MIKDQPRHRRYQRAFAFSILCLMMSGCAGTGRRPEPVQPATPGNVDARNRSDEQRTTEENIDIEGLERSLFTAPSWTGDSVRQHGDLGYQEAGFNTCAAGFGFSSSKACRKLVLAVVHVRLQCRDSEGTVSNALGEADLVAISGRTLKWSLQRHVGKALTDGDGYATLRALFSKSPSHDWLKLAVGLNF